MFLNCCIRFAFVKWQQYFGLLISSQHHLDFLVYAIDLCFPNCFVCRHGNKAKQITRRNSHTNLFMPIVSSNTVRARKVMIFFKDPHFFMQHNTISDVIDHYFVAALTQCWLKSCINIKYFKKPRHTCKLAGAHSLVNTAIDVF